MNESAEACSDSNDQLKVPATLNAADSDPVDLENPMEKSKENSREKATKSRRVTLKQKMVMANFIIENPELITHSSTKENEIELWNDLHQKLNDLKPERNLESWKNFLSRWRGQLLTKTEDSMTATDYKLKQFLNKIITTNDQIPNSQGSVKPAKTIVNAPKQTLHDVLDKIDEVEKERSNLRLEIDRYELRINKYKFLVHAMEDEIELKRSRIKKLSDVKTYLNKRRRMLQKKDNCVAEPTEFEETIENANESAQEQTEA